MAETEIAKLVIRLRGEVADLKKSFGEARREVSRLHEDMKSSVAGIKASWVALAAAAVLLKKGFDWGEIGAKAKQAQENYAKVTKAMGTDGDALIKNLQETGGVFVDTTDLMIKSQRLLAEGIKENEIVGMMTAARFTARQMGIDVKTAFDMISEAVLTQRTRGLRAAYPTMAEAAEIYKRTFGEMAGWVSFTGKQQAILNEIIGLTDSQIKKLGITMKELTAYESFQKTRSAAVELKEEIGLGLVPVWEKLLQVVQTIKKDFSGGFESGVQSWMEKIYSGEDTGPSWIDKLLGAGYQYEEALRRIDALQIAQGQKALSQYGGAKKAGTDDIKERDKAGKDLFLTEELRRAGVKFAEDLEIKGAKLTKDGNVVIEDRIRALRLEEIQTIATMKADEKLRGILVTPTQTPEEKKAEIPAQTGEARIRKFYARAISEEEAKIGKEAGLRKLESAVQLAKDEQKIMENALAREHAMALTEQAKISSDTAAIDLEYAKETADLKFASSMKTLDAEGEAEIQKAQMAGLETRSVNAKNMNAQMVAWGEYQKEISGIESAFEQKRREANRTAEEAEMEENFTRIGEIAQANADADAAKIVADRERNALMADYGGQLNTLKGNWEGIKNAEADVLRSQLANLQASKQWNDLTKEERDVLEEVYKRRIEITQAQRDMNVGALAESGLRKYSIDLNTQMADQFENAIPSAINSSVDAFGDFLGQMQQGKASLEDFVRAFVQGLLNVANQITMTMIKMAILKAVLRGGEVGAGSSELATVWTGATGGTIPGSGPVPILAHGGEYVQRKAAVDYYGESAMEMLNRRSIPRQVFAPFLESIRASRGTYLQAGGMVPAAASGGGGKSGPTTIVIANYTDPNEFIRALSMSSGQDAVINVISSKKATIKRILG